MDDNSGVNYKFLSAKDRLEEPNTDSWRGKCFSLFKGISGLTYKVQVFITEREISTLKAHQYRTYGKEQLFA